ncbi:GNAT family N-acetyltransferase [Micromonospora sp. CPCC 205546]|uniref:GNAT family N-acetyltransferase n=1 Tax=Micromonospora sp. CPCC 205546 TaxID=3122397 RepID=UPI002FF43C3F
MQATPRPIHEATASHADAINALGSRAFGVNWSLAFPRPGNLQRTITKAPRNGWAFTVTLEDNQVSGFAVIKPHMGEGQVMLESVWCELGFVTVADTHRGHGLGTDLVVDAQRRALAAGRLGMMATIHAKSAGWYTGLGWHVGDHGHALVIPDVRTRRYGPMVWVHQPRMTHPRWAWTRLDPARPVTAWTSRGGRVAQRDLIVELAAQAAWT